MRELRFRVLIKGKWLECGIGSVDGLNSDIRDENAPVVQFTGLKDRMGEDIFEQDILECDWGDGYVNGLVKWDERNASFYVEYMGNKDMDWFQEVDLRDIRIIGNSLENPELLEQPA